MDMTNILKLMVKKGISDIHFKVDAHPAVRVHGKLFPAVKLQKLTSKDIETLVAAILTKEQVERVLHLFVYDDDIITQDFVDFRWRSVISNEEHRQARLASMGGSGPTATDLTHRLHEVRQPTLVAFGAHDRFAALDSSISLMRHYPNAELHVFRNGGHWVQWELADDFNGVVLEWALRQKAAQRQEAPASAG